MNDLTDYGQIDCQHYKIVMKQRGDLDIELMQQAAKRLIGEHDFRNFCKMDVGNGVVTFFRRIDDIRIRLLADNASKTSDM